MSSPSDLPSLIAAAQDAHADAALAATAIGLIDLTSLRGDESEVEIEALCARALRHGTAAVCLYPRFVPLARRCLAGSGVRLATVANFPQGGEDIVATAEETAAAVAAGADEVDVVAPLEAILERDIGLVGELVEACRTAAGPDVTLKLILETGRLAEPDLITAAARAAVMAGIDFLKTSTGKVEPGATPEAAALLLAVCQEAHGRVGFKAAGGIRTADQAAGYLRLAGDMMGPAWISPHHLRLGASSLLDDLLRRAGRDPEGAAANGGY
ncbi:MAG: deoxyribose-phosphate aldolase [Geminicoccaceae bacterium]